MFDAALDAEIERVVFGATVLVDEGLRADHPDRYYVAPNESRQFVIPRYSTDIGAAMTVALRLRERGYWMEAQDLRRYGVDEWQVDLSHGGEGPEGCGKAQTLPEAICRAALQAVGRADAGAGRSAAAEGEG